MENNNSFEYTYSSQQREEVQNIRKKYMPKEENKMEQLRRLDRSVTQKGTVVSLVVGIIGTLIMGAGMSCVLVWKDMMFIPGIIIGVVGIAVLLTAYPLYASITKKDREKITPEILKLTEELMK